MVLYDGIPSYAGVIVNFSGICSEASWTQGTLRLQNSPLTLLLQRLSYIYTVGQYGQTPTLFGSRDDKGEDDSRWQAQLTLRTKEE